MHSFYTVQSSEEAPDERPEFVLTPALKASLPIVQRALECDHAYPMAISGRGCGRHTLLAMALQETRRQGYSIDVDEIRDRGVVCAQKLHRIIRSVAAVVVKEQQKIVEGEVVAMTNSKIQLKTRDMESEFEIGVRMRRELERERVCIGDIVKIYKESCFVVRLGKASDKNDGSRPDLLPKVVPPEGECIKNETVHTRLTLNELDVLNLKDNGEEYLYSDIDVNEYIREEVDKKIFKLLKERKAVLERGALVIDGCDSLTREEIKTVISLCAGVLQPVVFLIFDRDPLHEMAGVVHLRLSPYSSSEIREILKARTAALGIDDETMELLPAELGLSWAIKVVRASSTGGSVSSSEVKRILSVFVE